MNSHYEARIGEAHREWEEDNPEPEPDPDWAYDMRELHRELSGEVDDGTQ
jgi:hypothetical protein